MFRILNVHKVLTGEGSGMYLPFALARLRFLVSMTSNPVVQSFVIGAATVRVEANAAIDQHYVYIDAGGRPVYEFFTTDRVTTDGGVGTPPYNTDLYGSYVCGHTTQVSLGQTLTPRKVGSYTELDGASEKSYLDGAEGLVTEAAFNNQKFQPVQQWTTRDSDREVGVTSLMTLSVRCRPDTNLPEYGNQYQIARNDTGLLGDVGWDLRQTVFQGHKRVTAAVPLLEAPLWWRRGTTVLVDGHMVSVVTDAQNNFYFFKTGEQPADEDNSMSSTQGTIKYLDLSDGVIKVSAADYMPEWVAAATDDTQVSSPGGLGRVQEDSQYQTWSFTSLAESEFPKTEHSPNPSLPGSDPWGAAAPSHALYQMNQALWNFSSDGKKAVAIVGYDRGFREWQPVEFTGDVEHTFNGGPVTTNFKYAPLERMRQLRYNGFGMLDLQVPEKLHTAGEFSASGPIEAKVVTPALLELSLDISVSEDGVLSASVTVLQEDKDRWYVNAAYAYKHPDMLAKGVGENALVTGEICSYVYGTLEDRATPEIAHDSTYYPESCFVLSTYKIRSGGTDIHEFTISNSWSEVYRGILFPTYSFNRGDTIYAPLHLQDYKSNVPTVNVPNEPGHPDVQVCIYGGLNQKQDGSWEVCQIHYDTMNVKSYVCSHPFTGGIQASLRNFWAGDVLDLEEPRRVAVTSWLAAVDLRCLLFVWNTGWVGIDDTEVTYGCATYLHGSFVEESGERGKDVLEFEVEATAVDERLIKIYPKSADIEANCQHDNIQAYIDPQNPSSLLGRKTESVRILSINCYSAPHSALDGSETYPVNVVSSAPNGSYATHTNYPPWPTVDKVVYSYLDENQQLATTQTTHLELFNKAYNQSRTYDLYGADDREFGIGSIVSAGAWV